MGLFDKLKKLTDVVNADKLKGLTDSINSDKIKNLVNSGTGKVMDMADSINEESIDEKSSSVIDSVTDKLYPDIETSDFDEDNEVDDEIDEEDDIEDDDDEDDDDDDEEAEAKKRERNKKIAKGFAKGAMFVGSFLYTQKYEGADSGSALAHALKKTKQVDDMFDGKKKAKDEKKEQSSSNPIKSIVKYQYICPPNMRGFSNIKVPQFIEIPTVNSNGCCESEEAIKVIMETTGVNESTAQSIWHGASNLHWKKLSYTYVNNGQRGATVKCNG